jgi:hypothetical protein
MSTKHTDGGKGQETPPRDAPALSTAYTVQQAKTSPPGAFPPPPRRPSRSVRSSWFIVAAVIAVIALMFSVFALVLSQQGQHPATQVTPAPTAPAATVTTTPGRGDTTPAPTLGVIQGPQNGPAAVSDPAYWDRMLGTTGTERNVEKVSFANVLGNPTLQALVTVRHSNANRTLDAYVFDKITNAKPVQLFTMPGLIKGDAKISGYNSVMTAEVDKSSTLNAGKSSRQWTQDLFREFAWSQSKGTLVQVAFPGIFPDLTRYQAEADQALIDKGQDTWKNDPSNIAQALVTKFFQWKRGLKATVVSGGGLRDVDATVRVVETPGQDPLAPVPTVTVKLTRLEGNVYNMWVAIAVEDSSLLTLTSVEPRSLITSPVKLEGIGTTYGTNEGIIGPARVLDHLYTVIGQATLIGAVGLGKTPYSTSLTYTSSFRAGVQEGVVAVYEANAGTDDEIASAVLVKVLLDPEPGVAIGPCPALPPSTGWPTGPRLSAWIAASSRWSGLATRI